jgi:2'-5' RNA ligase
MRVFIAIDLSPDVRSAIADLQDVIRNAAQLKKGDVTWTLPERIHLTLNFLGEIEDSRAQQACEIASRVAAKFSRFSIRVKGVGTFGRPAKVLWVGLENSESLQSLQKTLEEELDRAGYPREDRAFSGHLTLARIKSFPAARKIPLLAKDYSDIDLGTFDVESVGVYKSQLTPQGPLYTLLSVCRFEL